MQSGLKSAVSSVVGLGCLALLVFIPARTVNYWQAWVFLGVLVCVTIPPTIHLRRIDPAAFQRRRKAGLRAEARTIQKFVVTALQANFAAVLVVSGFDHRFGWSGVPTVVVLLGDVLVALGLGGAMSFGDGVVKSLRRVAKDVRGRAMPRCAHWIAEEEPEALSAELLGFFGEEDAA